MADASGSVTADRSISFKRTGFDQQPSGVDKNGATGAHPPSTPLLISEDIHVVDKIPLRCDKAAVTTMRYKASNIGILNRQMARAADRESTEVLGHSLMVKQVTTGVLR
jgi:hypothetical protein